MRLAKWYGEYSLKERQRHIKEVTSLVLSRKPRSCNFIAYQGDQQIVYKRYASLFFVSVVDEEENGLMVLEVMHRFVETLDQYFENVCELDLIFNFPKAHYILDEFLMGGEVQEASMRAVLRAVQQADEMEADEQQEERRFF